MQEKMWKSEATLARIIDIASEAIISIDETQRIILFNNGAEQIFGYSSDEVIGQSLDLLLPRQAQTIHRIHITEFSRSAETARLMGTRQKISGRRKNGEEFPAEASIAKLVVGDKKIFITTLYDLSEQKQASAKLLESEEQYRTLFSESRDAIYMTTRDGRFLDVNQSALELFGYTRAEMLKLGVRAIYCYPIDREKFQEAIKRVGFVREYEVKFRKKDRREMDCLLTSTVRQATNGGILGYQGIIRDITERKQTRNDLQFTQFSIDHSADAAFWMESDARFFYVNEAACQFLGYSSEELLSMTVHDINPWLPAETWPNTWSEIKQRRSFTFESRHRTKDGRIFPVEITVNYVEFNGKEYNCAFSRDITDRKRGEEALRESNEQLGYSLEQCRQLSHKLLQIQENEYRFLSSELHDNIAQSLNAAKIDLERYMKSENLDLETCDRHIHSTTSQLRKISQEVRKLSRQMRPEILDKLGLVATLESFLRDFQRQVGIQTRFIHETRANRFLSNVEIHLYRITQEAINNIAKHAQASSVVIRLEQSEDRLILSIVDNGIGFDVEHATGGKEARGIGLISIKERANLLKGTMEIGSSPRHGTTLTIKVPLSA